MPPDHLKREKTQETRRNVGRGAASAYLAWLGGTAAEDKAAVAAQRRAEEQRLEVVLYKPTASARLGLVLTSRSTSHQPTVAALSAAKPPAPDRATEDDESPEDDDFDRGIDRPQRHSSRHNRNASGCALPSAVSRRRLAVGGLLRRRY